MKTMTLDEWLTANEISNAGFGQLIDLDEANVWRIRKGKQLPSVETARRIVAATKNAVTFNELFGEAS